MRRLVFLFALVAGFLALGVFVLFPTRPSSGSADVSTTAAVSGPTLAQSNNDQGRTLFDENCSTCHGINAGGSALAPNLRGVGAATVDLWVGSGWMPLASPTAEPIRKPAKFTPEQTVAIAEYIQSLAGGLQIPSPDVRHANVSIGFSLFTLNCAPCHTITGAGDALSNGFFAPGLHGLTTTQIEEAIETGPSQMPRFYPGALTATQVDDVVAYVHNFIETPVHPGGVGLGGVGPVAEGYIGLFVGVGVCLLVAMWIGERTKRDDEPEGHGDASEGAHA